MGRQLIVCALVLAVPAAVIDAVLLARAVGAREVVAGGLAAGALGVFVAALVAVPMAAGARIGRRSVRVGVVTVVGFGVAWWLLDPLGRRVAVAYVVMAVLAGVVLGALAWLDGAKGPVRVAAALVAAAACTMDVWIEPARYVELHDVSHVVMAASLVVAFGPVRARVAELARWRVVAVAAVMLAMAVGLAVGSERVAPGWRSSATAHALHATRLARAIRGVADLDRDGYSAIAWGTDCDDLDGARHPGAVDEPGGGDANCNGVDPPASPAPSAFGLAPAVGTPHLPAGDIDLVVLVTIDTLRADVLVPEIMPELSRVAAARGVVFERMYPSGARTLLSLPLMLKADDDDAWMAEQVAASGVTASAVLAVGGIGRFGFARAEFAGDAAGVTEVALRRAREVTGPHFLHVHYYDPHQPRVRRGVDIPTARQDLPRGYLSSVAFADRHVARLLESLPTERTVVIVTADHGEAFGEHGVHGHGASGYEQVIAVPGILFAPGLRPGRDARLMTTRGLPATVWGALGFAREAAAAERFGRSWLRVRDAPVDAPLHDFVVVRSARYSSGAVGHTPLAVLVAPRWKLVASFDEGLFELYDRDRDPGERRSVAADRPDVVEQLWRRLALYCDLDRYP